MFKTIVHAAVVAAIFGQPTSAWAESDAGAYLAARQAQATYDFGSAARFFTQGLRKDPQNPHLLENALTSYVLLKQLDQAVPVAKAIREAGYNSQLANLVLATDAGLNETWDDIFSALEAGHEISPLVDGLFQSWAALGRGDMEQAIASFDEVIEGEGMRAYGDYHKSLALASVGDFEGADAIMSAPRNSGRVFSARAAIAHAQILSQLDRNDEALAMLQAVFGDTVEPRVGALRQRLSNGETVPYTLVSTPQQGMAEVLFMIAGILEGEARNTYTLQYARLAQALDPASTDAIMLSAQILTDMDRFRMASETYASVPANSYAFPAAEMGRIDALRRVKADDAAIEVARALSRSHPELPVVHAKLADVLRGTKQFEAAFAAYSTALDLLGDRDGIRWRVLYTRAITAHAQDNWPQAERDFRAALELRPNQPQVLNYLGYSLVERGEKLDEALEMIETAVAAQPDNGAIVDSLGWVLFELGRHDEAVVHLERAAALEAVDPVINDHLGDAYWTVGRETEAVFQWNRALSFDPDEKIAARIRQKLELGLDAVLEAEGNGPIKLANDES